MSDRAPGASGLANREIAAHLALLVLLLGAAVALHGWQTGPSAVPSLVRALDSERLDTRSAAVARLRELGPEARAAVPRLLALAADPRSGHAGDATAALRLIDPGAAEIAMQGARTMLAAGDLNARRRAAEALGRLGLLARAAVADLATAARDPDAVLRDRALAALGQIGLPPATVLPVLIAGTQDPAAHVRHAALAAIEQLPAAAATAALPDLRQRAEDGDPAVSQRARFLVDRLSRPPAPEAALAAARLAFDRLAESRREARLHALDGIARLGPAAAPLASRLGERLASLDPGERHAAIVALGAIGPAAAPALPSLRADLDSPDPALRTAARQALVAIDPRAAAANRP